MKLQEIIFTSPIKVFQIFRNLNIYGKAMKSFETRKNNMEWGIFYSKAGYISNNELYLPEQILKNPDFKNCDLITIEDDRQPHTFTTGDLSFTKVIGSNNSPLFNHCINLKNQNKLDIFEIRNEEEIELHLQYGYFEVGIPKRNNFKLCELIQNQPVEIKINGKTDSSLSSGRERIFKEQYYIFEYMGDFEKCKILKEPYAPYLKHVPTERKTIDLLKKLW